MAPIKKLKCIETRDKVHLSESVKVITLLLSDALEHYKKTFYNFLSHLGIHYNLELLNNSEKII